MQRLGSRELVLGMDAKQRGKATGQERDQRQGGGQTGSRGGRGFVGQSEEFGFKSKCKEKPFREF